MTVRVAPKGGLERPATGWPEERGAAGRLGSLGPVCVERVGDRLGVERGKDELAPGWGEWAGDHTCSCAGGRAGVWLAGWWA